MDLAQYRRELKNYHAAREKNQLEKCLGSTPTISDEEIDERFSDLFTLTSVGSLEKSLENADELTETETKARRNLLAIARLGFLRKQAEEVTGEYENCRESLKISFQNEKLTFSEALARIQTEDTAALRREIYNRFTETRNSCADLLREKFKIWQENARKIGSENLRELFAKITETDPEILTPKAENFLAATEESYFRLFPEFIAESKPSNPADFYYWQYQSERKDIFAGKKLPGFYRRILENFGFQAEKISSIKIVEVVTEGQKCVFRPNFPTGEVYFGIFSGRDGNTAFIEFLKNFGKAQRAAWTSTDLANRFPEFVFSPDDSLGAAYAILFQSLLTDERFLRLNFGLWNEKLVRKISQENRFRLIFEIRRNILRFLFEAKFYSSLDADTAREFATIFSQNLGFAISESDVFFQLSGDFASLKFLRAAQFGFGLREYLRARYDFDWWNKRGAFEELIDFWNTAERYKIEEMARMIGFETSFDLLREI